MIVGRLSLPLWSKTVKWLMTNKKKRRRENVQTKMAMRVQCRY
jgi:hypothetical protein